MGPCRARTRGAGSAHLGGDVIAPGLDPRPYREIARRNGAGRAAKSFGRQVLVGRRSRASWAEVLRVRGFAPMRMLQGDVCSTPLGTERYDAVLSWSVFEHLADPRPAVQNIITALRPGGAFYLSIHLYTANDGHHDLRAFLRAPDAPPPWAHLRPTTRSLVQPSAFLNEWRLAGWRDLFDELAPEHVEHLDCFEHPERFGPLLDGALREELADYTDEELLTVNAVFAWRKPER